MGTTESKEKHHEFVVGLVLLKIWKTYLLIHLFFLFRYTKDPKTETNNGFIEGSGKVFLRPKYNGEVNFDWSASSDPIFERVSAQHTMDWKLALSFIMMSSSFSIDPYFCINSKQIKFFNSQFYLKVLSNSKRALVFFVSPLLR